ncbi:MAG: hypothetical protein DHS20C18_04310 [Saprospiraceae bacterium]|nr:MAG: hypothetical protein DHS20C18_04310 [Saprospiraceae bacterium]
MKKVKIFSWLLFSLLLASCDTTKTISGDAPSSVDREFKDNTVITVYNPLSLADYLIQVPGVNVDERIGGTMVTVRGRVPLYVIDGIPIGHSYNEANNIVNVYDIDSVEVLKGPTETILYGRRGANGVIVIRTIRN